MRRRRIACRRDAINFDNVPGERINFEVAETRFDVEGAELAGRLVMPGGTWPVPVVVLVHGAESTSARDVYALQRMFPAAGIGAFVYDKRGTGDFSGVYTHDYLTLGRCHRGRSCGRSVLFSAPVGDADTSEFDTFAFRRKRQRSTEPTWGNAPSHSSGLPTEKVSRNGTNLQTIF